LVASFSLKSIPIFCYLSPFRLFRKWLGIAQPVVSHDDAFTDLQASGANQAMLAGSWQSQRWWSSQMSYAMFVGLDRALN
ncbi:hypothetical protein, partial [Salmonella sp. SAL04284]|uniref:hypothetical protein n=1 Tax=Salmonella sp. SAL04284 TaxID=3159862 RepID=UPI0039790593